AQERVNSLIETIHLGSHRKQLAKNLSGGLKRRLQVIMGLVHDPEIVMFDEPTPGLDPQSRLLVLDYIQALAKKEHKTILLTTHFIDESERISDRVAIIDHGKLLVLSTVDALKESMGEGDALELNIEPIEKVEDARKIISSTIDSSIVSSGNLLILRSPGLIQRIPDILTNLERAGATVANMKVRKTSLEDVFISLTGRQLRD
ncbi:MAG TPA: ABC transporter ATP-binding protein, partial [Candidatus Hodarchaeales archaeon]|nr:ABC transporter ATP-binding protein [Candidatus Hodarchaeales archaeon]